MGGFLRSTAAAHHKVYSIQLHCPKPRKLMSGAQSPVTASTCGQMLSCTMTKAWAQDIQLGQLYCACILNGGHLLLQAHRSERGPLHALENAIVVC